MGRFAAEGGERHQNRDGWGIMFADGHDGHLFREAAPASDSLLDRFVREHESPSDAVIAHVRRASHGTSILANTHPFRRVRSGYAQHFAHNGSLADLESMPEARSLRAECVGETDSELAFLILLGRLGKAAPCVSEISRRFDVFTEFAREMSCLGTANFLYFDGYALYVFADQRVWETDAGLTAPQPPGLHMLRYKAGKVGAKHRFAAGTLSDIADGLILFASVPLNERGWLPIIRGTSLVVRNGEVLARSHPEATALAL
jgi:glutamine amidotransferase